MVYKKFICTHHLIGKCKYLEKCNKIHTTQSEKSSEETKKGEDTELCWHFTNAKCRHGDNCYKIHVRDERLFPEILSSAETPAPASIVKKKKTELSPDVSESISNYKSDLMKLIFNAQELTRANESIDDPDESKKLTDILNKMCEDLILSVSTICKIVNYNTFSISDTAEFENSVNIVLNLLHDKQTNFNIIYSCNPELDKFAKIINEMEMQFLFAQEVLVRAFPK